MYFAFGMSGMTYRPASSVTTILANFVGRSVVSAMTQTPASGPLALETTPPRSFSPIAGACARAEMIVEAINAATAAADRQA